MRKATYNEKSLVSGILTESFDTNQSVNYMVQQDHKRRERIRALMDYSFEVCSLFGEVYVSDNNHACALVLYPDKTKTTIKSVLLDIGLVFKCIGFASIGRAFRRESKIKKIQPKEPIYYLWFIGVGPEFQGSGTGSKLMRELIEDSRKKELPICLETSTLGNLPWYNQFGFKVYQELDLSYTLYFLKRNLTKQ